MKLFNRAAEAPKGLGIHDLRHPFGSLLLIDEGDIFKLSRIGHSSVAIIERTYARPKPTAYATDYGALRSGCRMPVGFMR